jgi:hypothetical protein
MINRLAFCCALLSLIVTVWIERRPLDLSRYTTASGIIELRDEKTGQVILSADDIAKYDWQTHRIELANELPTNFRRFNTGPERLKLFVDGEIIFNGSVVSIGNSAVPTDVHFFIESRESILIRAGARAKWHIPADLRNNRRLYFALRKKGILR